MAMQAKGFPVNGKKLQELRKRRGWDVIDLVARSGVKKRTIERYESGGNALPGYLSAIADVLQVEVETLWADYKLPVTEPNGTASLSQEHLEAEGVERGPTAESRAILEQNISLAKELGVTQSALQNFFEILEQQHIPTKDLDAKLREIAAAHIQFQQRLQAMDSDNVESSRLYVEALAAAERGEYVCARSLLDEADRIDAEEMEALDARRNKKLLSRAATSAAKGDSYKTQLRYTEAAECYRQAVSFVEQIPEGNERELAIYLNLLGIILHDQGDFVGAKPLFERVLAIREKALGLEHPETAVSLNNLASILYIQRDFARSTSCHERALAIREKALGLEHPETALSLLSLGILLHTQGDFVGAKPLFERALAVQEKVLGLEHPETARVLHALGHLLHDQGNFVEAKPCYERALAVREEVFGPEHPDTASSLNKLGNLLHDQGNFAEARSYYERALAVQEEVFGPEHLDIAISLYSLGVLLKDQGNFAEARSYYERSLAIWEKVLGPEHSETARVLSNLGALLKDQGDFTEAKAYYERTLSILEKTLGPGHPRTIETSNHLAALSQNSEPPARSS
jgi:tetratricopeptide (TPR) repeat protein